MPGGVTANIKFFEPYPTIMTNGSGAYLDDLDGNEYIDYLLSYGALMTGHGHPKVLEAIHKQINVDGTLLFGTPHRLEVKMGQKSNSYIRVWKKYATQIQVQKQHCFRFVWPMRIRVNIK